MEEAVKYLDNTKDLEITARDWKYQNHGRMICVEESGVSSHVWLFQDLCSQMNPLCLLAIYPVVYIDAPGDLT